MFYVGNILWVEKGDFREDIPANFTGGVFWSHGTKYWYNKGEWQSFQDPETGEWMPARIWANGKKFWYNKGEKHSFQNPVTGERMPAFINPDGRKSWFDNGFLVKDPKTHDWTNDNVGS